jgi:hypothetical protein
MREQLEQLANKARADIVAADAVLDQLQLDRLALQERQKQLEQDAALLQQAQQKALMDKHDAKNELVLLERLLGGVDE